MKNGDRLTCEIKSLDRGTLSVKLDYVDGTIAVDWAKVTHLESNQFFVVLTEDGSSYEGTLSSTERPEPLPPEIRITQPTGKKVVEVKQSGIVRMDESAEKFQQRFNGALNFGVVYSKGNNATQYSFGTDTDYRRERWGAEGAFNSTLSANSGSTTSTRNQANLMSYRLLRWDNYFYEGLGSFLQSSVQGITLQTTLGGGVGHFFKNTNKASIAVLGGLAWQNTDYKSSAPLAGTQSIASGLIAAETKLFKFKKTNLDLTGILLPAISDPGRLRFNVNATYYLKLFSNLSWNASFYGSWDNRPPSGLSGSDYGTSSGLSWTFGNR
jgi:hypothetical protein